MAGRTHGQHAVPITFGLKAASWADELLRCEQRLEAAAAAVATAQLGGAAGTLASLGDAAAPVRAAFCRLLGLAEADVPWHAARDRVRDLGHALAELGAAGERIAAEVIRLQATGDCRALRAARQRRRRLLDDATEAQPDDERVPRRDRPAYCAGPSPSCSIA